MCPPSPIRPLALYKLENNTTIEKINKKVDASSHTAYLAKDFLNL
jgi:hypothetical protein